MSTSAIIRVTTENGLVSSLYKHHDGYQALTGRIIGRTLEKTKGGDSKCFFPILMMGLMPWSGYVLDEENNVEAKYKYSDILTGGVYMAENEDPEIAQEEYYYDIKFGPLNSMKVSIYKWGKHLCSFESIEELNEYLAQFKM